MVRSEILALGIAAIGLAEQRPASAAPDAAKVAKSSGSTKAPSEEDEDEVPLARVPAKVRKGADSAAPKVKWEAAYRTKEDGHTHYELEGSDAKGREVVVTLTEEGELVEIETEIPLRDVPDVVRDAIKARWPRFKMSAAFEIRKDGKVTGYDLEGKRPADKHEIGLSVSADGKEIEIDEGE
jgi:hypothetical protein